MSPDGGDARPGADEVPAPGAAPAFTLGVSSGALALVVVALVVVALGALLLLRLRPETLEARDRVSVQRAALLTLFVDREHPRQLVFWSDAAHRSPTLHLLGDIGLTLVAQQPDTAALALPMPVHLESLASMEQHFRTSPDGWETWFTRFPASSGIIALTRPELLPVLTDGRARARVVVARTCGEHCHSAWRVTLQRTAGGAWRTRTVEPLTLPRD